MGSHTTFRIRDRSYRPEEVAARLIRHAQSVVESFLRARVRERIADYFHNNQKNATRDACEIAGVTVLRLMHEPTAACIAVHRERRLAQNVVVVDLGAGTLDLSQIDAENGVYDVKQVLGNSEYGGRDFDVIIARALVGQLGARGITVGETGARRRRLDVAAEQLKIALSSQDHAEYVMRGFDDGQDVTLVLSRDESEGLLADALRPLRDACARFRRRSATVLDDGPCSLILVGGPLLSPAVHRVVEEALGLSRVGVSDPQMAVACGAALQGAVLDGTLSEILLLDVTPLALGIKTKGEDKAAGEFTTLIEENTTIPTKRAEMFTTTRDFQPEVDIEVFQGQLSPQSKIGQFRLEGIPPARMGEPKIEVTFDIDDNCVLTVTARNAQTGASISITLTNTTLLPPTERQRLATVFAEQQKQQEVRGDAHLLLADTDEQLTDADVLVREWRGRLEAYRPSAADPDPTTRTVLAEMFNTGHEVESELLAVELALHDLAANVRAHFDRPDHDSGVAAAQNLCEQLRANLNRYRGLRDTIARWNAVLVRVAVAQTDPLRSFLAWHEAGDHARALEAVAHLSVPLAELQHVRRHLDCLAHVGDSTGYESLLREHAGRLGAVPVDAADPVAFLTRARSSLAQVRAPGGMIRSGSRPYRAYRRDEPTHGGPGC